MALAGPPPPPPPKRVSAQLRAHAAGRYGPRLDGWGDDAEPGPRWRRRDPDSSSADGDGCASRALLSKCSSDSTVYSSEREVRQRQQQPGPRRSAAALRQCSGHWAQAEPDDAWEGEDEDEDDEESAGGGDEQSESEPEPAASRQSRVPAVVARLSQPRRRPAAPTPTSADSRENTFVLAECPEAADADTAQAVVGCGEAESCEHATTAASEGGSGGGQLSRAATAGGRTPRAAGTWSGRDNLAWERWYERKLSEERQRRRQAEAEQRLKQQEQEKSQAEAARKRELEEENRRKWLERKRLQGETDKRKEAKEQRQAELKAQQERDKYERRMAEHLDLVRKWDEMKSQMRKEAFTFPSLVEGGQGGGRLAGLACAEDAERKAAEERRREAEAAARRERSERAVAQWRARAARRPRPMTGSIYEHSPLPSVPKPALDFYNPMPWQS